MNQIAALISPANLPNAAGAVAAVTSVDTQGGDFAGILAQFQSLLANNAPAAVGGDGATAQIENALAASAIQSQTSTGDATVPQPTDALAASLAQIQGVLGFQNKIETPSTDSTLAGIDANFAAQFAALQTALQATSVQPTVATQQTVTTAPANQSAPAATTAPVDQSAPVTASAVQPDLRATAQQTAPIAPPDQSTPATATAPQLELRGTLPLEPGTARPKDTAQTTIVQTPPTAQSVEAAIARLGTAAPPSSADAPANPAPNAVKLATTAKRTPNAAQPDPGAQTSTPAPPLKSSETLLAASQTATAAFDANAVAQPAQQGAVNANASQPAQPVGVNPGHVLPNVIAAQQFEAAPATTAQLPVPLEALAAHIARKFEGGASQFEISLHPADLGQLDISLSVSADGQVQAAVRAERPETLELLQRDSRNLEQQLRQAGLDVGSNALSFSLSNGNNQRQSPFSGWPAFANASGDASEPKEIVASKYVAVRVRDGIDISV